MIGKVPKAGRGFKGLVQYLLRGGRDSPGDDRVAWTDVRNLTSDDPELAPALMRATARLNRRCLSPAYHLVISWARTERPTDDVMRQVADRTCTDIGLDEMQRLYVAHDDTDHHHLHIVVNRIHPENGKAWNRRQDWVRIERSLADQSREMGMDHVPGRHNDPETFTPTSKKRTRTPHRERRQVLETLLTPWTDERVQDERERLAEVVRQARSWDDLDGALAAEDKYVVRKGQGYVIADRHGCMKLSSLGKSFGGRDVDQRFGKRPVFDPPDVRLEAKFAAFARAGEANESADFALSLYRLGLIGPRELERSMSESREAIEDAVHSLSMAEWIARESARVIAREDGDDDAPRRARTRPRERDRDDR